MFLSHPMSTGRVAAPLLLVLMLLTSSVACGPAAVSPDELAASQRLAARCVPAQPPASWVALDGTASGASDSIFTERLAALRSIVRATAACGGLLKVSVFTASSAATTTLFDDALRLPGATENARLRRLPDLVADVIAAVRGRYGAAVRQLDRSGSDIIGQFRLAGEWLRQLGSGYRLQAYLLTDGTQTIGGSLTARLRPSGAPVQLAAAVPVPPLPGARVVVAGLGRVAGRPLSSASVERLVAFYSALCRRTRAAQCTAVSEYQADDGAVTR